jgi:hypothetical protein
MSDPLENWQATLFMTGVASNGYASLCPMSDAEKIIREYYAEYGMDLDHGRLGTGSDGNSSDSKFK